MTAYSAPMNLPNPVTAAPIPLANAETTGDRPHEQGCQMADETLSHAP